MARAVPNVHFRFDFDDTNLDHLSREVTRHYLHLRLRDLDAKIAHLTYVQEQEAWHVLERAAWREPAAAEIMWTGRLELHHLLAMREALANTLMKL
jgi:hypothetical protein